MMDAKKATALHRYYEECETEEEGSWYLFCAGASAVMKGCSVEELDAIAAIADCDWAPEWAKERYT